MDDNAIRSISPEARDSRGHQATRILRLFCRKM
jgi:hypothetical protein